MGKKSLNKERYFGWSKHHNPTSPKMNGLNVWYQQFVFKCEAK